MAQAIAAALVKFIGVSATTAATISSAVVSFAVSTIVSSVLAPGRANESQAARVNMVACVTWRKMLMIIFTTV